MAYNVYFACDRCGREGFAITNRTLSYCKAVKIARKQGWMVGQKGWFCLNCRMKYTDCR